MPALLSRMIRIATVSPRMMATAAARAVPAQEYDPKRTFYHKDLEIEVISPQFMLPKPKDPTALKFGHTYADHMMQCDWDQDKGWMAPRIEPLREFRIHPGAKVLHYASELFEGMKAYRGVDNKIRLFRPEMNMARMKRTALRAALPDFDGEELIQIICDMLRIDQEWVPYSDVCSLYLRPTLIGTDPTLGVGCANTAKLFVITGPVGAYYATGFQPVSLLADSRFIRAFPGGVGAYKMGCNYAPTIWVGKEAANKNCQQVLWLYGESEDLTEVGTMNIFLFWKNLEGDLELITPPLHRGLILPGVTRDSLLELGREWGEFKVTERTLNMGEVKRALDEKRLYEMFGAGTACVVSPVGKILYHNKETDDYEEWHIPTMVSKYGVMKRFFNTINDIQYGRIIKDNWVREI
ncbi:unnamed protein product [Caenorhabditis bovis]|uniref:Branched-chain-amino-acid aminotransferase n=1 Tax=Caenorhabditis bovis TaxID=2654633 RepID=A0A8S1EHD3_9PELO|nr:unnamed protein product [Caenorhabditis bovis]